MAPSAPATARPSWRRRPSRLRSKKTRGRPRSYVFRHQPRDRSFTLTLHFKRSVVERDELVSALLQTLDDLRSVK